MVTGLIANPEYCRLQSKIWQTVGQFQLEAHFSKVLLEHSHTQSLTYFLSMGALVLQ